MKAVDSIKKPFIFILSLSAHKTFYVEVIPLQILLLVSAIL